MERKRVLLIGLAPVLLLVLTVGLMYAQGPGPQVDLGGRGGANLQAPLGPQAPLGDAFTYQGFLSKDGDPIDDSCDFQFGLWDDPISGTLVAGPIGQSGVPLSGGYFTVQLDFDDVFDGTALWLEVAVQCPGDGGYSTLDPRQALTAAPYASYSRSTGALQGYPVASTAPTTSQALKWDGAAWVPAADDDSTYNAGVGLDLAGTLFSVTLSYRLPQACAGGQIAEWDGTAWQCGDDDPGGDYWALTGNAGTVPGTHFLGTTDGMTLTLAVSGTVGLRLVPTRGTPNLIGGSEYNTVTLGVEGAVIDGGGNDLSPNRVMANYATVGGGGGNSSGYFATVGGGEGNQASDEFTTVGGGYGNTATNVNATVGGGGVNEASGEFATVSGGESNLAGNDYATVGGGGFNSASGYGATVGGGSSNLASWDGATVGGGSDNEASGLNATVGGGFENVASGEYATVGGGEANEANYFFATVGGGNLNSAIGQYATVAGGQSNTAQGDWSFAAGRRAKANHQGAFVWADSTDADFTSGYADTFRVRATNGADFACNNANYGLSVTNDGNGDGIRALSNVSQGNQWGAVYAVNYGTSPAVYGSTGGMYSGYFNDPIYVNGGCVGCILLYVGLNDGPDALEAGDLVAVRGVNDPLVRTTTPVLRVHRAAGSADGVIGVVRSRATIVVSRKNGEQLESANQAEGPAAPGDYLFVVVQGIADVKADATASAIAPGQHLTVAERTGYARASHAQGLEPAVGIALAPLSQGQDTIPVFITLGDSGAPLGAADTGGAALIAENAALQQQVNDLGARLAALEEAAGNAAPPHPWSTSLLPGAGILLAVMGVVWVARQRGGGR